VSEQKSTAFVPLEAVVEDVLLAGREAFLEAYPHAILIVDDVGLPAGEAHFHTISRVPGQEDPPPASGGGGGDGGGAKEALERILGHLAGSASKFVVPLENREQKFAAIVTLGRAAGNQLRVNLPTLSKFHAYFTHVARDGCWYLSDANSSNGTFLDGEELPPSHGKVRLRSGAFIRFGPDVSAQFYESRELWDLFEKARADAGSGDETGAPAAPEEGAAAEEPAPEGEGAPPEEGAAPEGEGAPEEGAAPDDDGAAAEVAARRDDPAEPEGQAASDS